MKLNTNRQSARVVFVAPHAGAWIETLLRKILSRLTVVAPHAGAWIETLVATYVGEGYWGRPPRGGVD